MYQLLLLPWSCWYWGLTYVIHNIVNIFVAPTIFFLNIYLYIHFINVNIGFLIKNLRIKFLTRTYFKSNQTRQTALGVVSEVKNNGAYRYPYALMKDVFLTAEEDPYTLMKDAHLTAEEDHYTLKKDALLTAEEYPSHEGCTPDSRRRSLCSHEGCSPDSRSARNRQGLTKHHIDI